MAGWARALVARVGAHSAHVVIGTSGSCARYSAARGRPLPFDGSLAPAAISLYERADVSASPAGFLVTFTLIFLGTFRARECPRGEN